MAVKNAGCDSEKPCSTFTPCAAKNFGQEKFGVNRSASARLTKWYWLLGVRSSTGASEALARRISRSITHCAWILA